MLKQVIHAIAGCMGLIQYSIHPTRFGRNLQSSGVYTILNKYTIKMFSNLRMNVRYNGDNDAFEAREYREYISRDESKLSKS
jgi:hypothetical protein